MQAQVCPLPEWALFPICCGVTPGCLWSEGPLSLLPQTLVKHRLPGAPAGRAAVKDPRARLRKREYFNGSEALSIPSPLPSSSSPFLDLSVQHAEGTGWARDDPRPHALDRRRRASGHSPVWPQDRSQESWGLGTDVEGTSGEPRGSPCSGPGPRYLPRESVPREELRASSTISNPGCRHGTQPSGRPPSPH